MYRLITCEVFIVQDTSVLLCLVGNSRNLWECKSNLSKDSNDLLLDNCNGRITYRD